jgi:hypothetical protein
VAENDHSSTGDCDDDDAVEAESLAFVEEYFTAVAENG